jgi:hypothetical protein
MGGVSTFDGSTWKSHARVQIILSLQAKTKHQQWGQGYIERAMEKKDTTYLQIHHLMTTPHNEYISTYNLPT